LRKIFEIGALEKYTVGLKLPPYFDPAHWTQAIDVINEYATTKRIEFVTCCNSIGNGLVIDYENESTVIKPKNGHGGIGGDYIKPVALANVRQFYTHLGNKIGKKFLISSIDEKYVV
jgi:dihydroorotate dehydrogenase (fumarate)